VHQMDLIGSAHDSVRSTIGDRRQVSLTYWQRSSCSVVRHRRTSRSDAVVLLLGLTSLWLCADIAGSAASSRWNVLQCWRTLHDKLQIVHVYGT